MAEPIGDIPIQISGDWTQLRRDLDAAASYSTNAARTIADAFATGGKGAAGIGSGFDQAAAGAYNFSKSAQSVINVQKELDKELVFAKGALVDIRLAFDQGLASANALARAEENVRNASAAANVALRDVNKAAEEAAAANKKAAQDIEEAWRNTQRSLTTVGIALTAAITAPMVAGFKTATEESMKFGLAMHEVASIMDTTSDVSLKKLSGQVLDLSVRLGVDATKAARGLYEALSANIPEGNALSFIEVATKASIAGLTNTKVAVDGLTSVLNAFHLQTSETTKVADAMFVAIKLGKFRFDELSASMAKAMPLAAQVGVSFQEVLAAAATITKSGVPVSQAFTEIQRAITSLIAPSKEMRAVFEQLGVESGKQLLQQNGLAGSLQLVRDALGDEEGAVFKAMRRMEGFRALLSLTGENLAGAKKDLDEVTNSTGRMDVAFQEIEKSGSRGFDHLKASMEALAITAGDALAPALGEIIKNMQPLIQGLIDAVKWFATLDPAIQKFGLTLAALAAAAGPVALAVVGFLKLREAALLAKVSLDAMGGAVSLLSKAPWVALVGSLVALANATYEWKQARESLHQSEQQEIDGLARLEISLRQQGVNITELSNQYNHGLIGLTEYMRGLQALAVEHGNALPKVLATAKGVKDLGENSVAAAGNVGGLAKPIKDIGKAAEESKTSIDAFMESWNKKFEAAIPPAEDLEEATRRIAKAAYEAAAAIGEIPPEFPVTLAQIAEQAKAAGISLEVMIPPDLKPKIDGVSEAADRMGDKTVSAGTRSRDSLHEVRQAINSISEGIANAIIHWKGFEEAGVAVLQAIGKAILKNVIQQLLDATGVVDTLVKGIGKVLSAIGIPNIGTGGAPPVNVPTSGLPPTGNLGQGVSGLSNIVGIAGAGIAAASGIVNGIQNARMENLLSGIELSTRATKEQLVGGTQTVLLTWLPKLDLLVGILGALNGMQAALLDVKAALVQNTGFLTELITNGSGSTSSAVLATRPAPTTGSATGGDPISAIAENTLVVADAVKRRGPNVLNPPGGGSTSSQSVSGDSLYNPNGPGFRSAQIQTLAMIYSQAKRDLGLSTEEFNASVQQTITDGIKNGWIAAGTTIQEYLLGAGTKTSGQFSSATGYESLIVKDGFSQLIKDSALTQYKLGNIDKSTFEASVQAKVTAEQLSYLNKSAAVAPERGVTPGYQGGFSPSVGYLPGATNLSGAAGPVGFGVGSSQAQFQTGNAWEGFNSSAFLKDYYQKAKDKQIAEWQAAIDEDQKRLAEAVAYHVQASIDYYTNQIKALQLNIFQLSQIAVTDAPALMRYGPLPKIPGYLTATPLTPAPDSFFGYPTPPTPGLNPGATPAGSPMMSGTSAGFGVNSVNMTNYIYTNDPQVVANTLTTNLWNNGIKAH